MYLPEAMHLVWRQKRFSRVAPSCQDVTNTCYDTQYGHMCITYNNSTCNICLLSALSYTTLLFECVALVRTDLISKLPTQNQMVVSNITF